MSNGFIEGFIAGRAGERFPRRLKGLRHAYRGYEAGRLAWIESIATDKFVPTPQTPSILSSSGHYERALSIARGERPEPILPL